MAHAAWRASDIDIKQTEKLGGVLNQEQLAEYFGLSAAQFRYAMDNQPRLRKAWGTGRANAITRVAKTLMEKAMNGNVTAMIFYLKTQAGWWDVQKIEHNTTTSDSKNAETEETARREVLGRMALISKRIREEEDSEGVGGDGVGVVEGSEVRLAILGEARPASA